MDVPMLMVANAASVENELLNVVGGGWDFFTCSTFPGAVQGTLCGQFRVTAEERSEPRAVKFEARHHTGESAGFAAEIVLHATAGDGPATAAFVMPFAFVVHETSLIDFVLTSNDVEIGKISLPVRSLSNDG